MEAQASAVAPKAIGDRASLSARLPLGVVTIRIVPSASRLGEPLRLVLQQGPPSIDMNGSVTEAGQVAAWW